MSKYVKQLMIDELRESFDGVRDLLVLDLTGVDAVSDNQFRLKLRQKEIRLRVIRNNLARKVFADAGLEEINPLLEGPSAVAWSEQGIVELAKEIAEWAEKIDQLRIKGGTTDGRVISTAEVEQLSKLPSREELLGRVVAQALSPASRTVALLQSPARRLAAQIQTRSEGEGSEAAS